MIEPSLNASDLADTRLACIHSITYLRKYVEGEYAPHYQVPATLDLPVSFITALWLNAKSRRQRMKTQRWWFALCFDHKTGRYTG